MTASTSGVSKSYFGGLTGQRLAVLQTTLVTAPAFILFGYNQAGLGGLIGLTDWQRTFPEIDTTHNKDPSVSTLKGFVVATAVIGAFFGSLSCSYTGDKFGRRHVIFFAGLSTLIGEVLECSAFGLAQLIVGRIIIGFAIGQLSTIVPVWQSETSGAKNRGRHVVLDGLFICLGFVFESWINFGFFHFGDSPVTWRPPIAIAILFSLVLCGSVYLFPESPRWLVAKNRSSEALAVLSVLRGLPQDSMEVQAELSGIELSLEETTGQSAKLSELLNPKNEDKLLYRFGLCILLQFFQQMSGTNLVSVYATILFQDNLGMSPQLSRVLTGGALTWKFLSSFLAFFCIDRFGRRVVFIISGTGMAACMVALAVATSFPEDNRAAMISAGCFLYLFNTFVPIGFLGANFLYCTEVAPVRLRMVMTSISTANHWLWNFVVVMVTPVAISTIGSKYYIVYAVIAACIPISVYFLFPETMGRNLEEIDLMFRDSPSVWGTVKYAKTRPVAMPQEFERKQKAEHVEGAVSESESSR
ncbi:sugar transporter STL1 [Magnaporthiopsis poae ATCC 64411]|uniref:Sugar transporter STL1 n=1 Tax=Magnaporthiopsis poae (strain ATCC 64411 / 73-15) TaxID=644358 RepID=A0A0C4DU09_MAGP6|nr:sugar transporter STL1 [Magnaporthiopsis poae ATCC 64411]